VRGRNGGIRLMREPRHINIGQVVRDTENQLSVIGCLERRGFCAKSGREQSLTFLTCGRNDRSLPVPAAAEQTYCIFTNRRSGRFGV